MAEEAASTVEHPPGCVEDHSIHCCHTLVSVVERVGRDRLYYFVCFDCPLRSRHAVLVRR